MVGVSVLGNLHPFVPEMEVSLLDPEEKGKDWPPRGIQRSKRA